MSRVPRQRILAWKFSPFSLFTPNLPFPGSLPRGFPSAIETLAKASSHYSFKDFINDKTPIFRSRTRKSVLQCPKSLTILPPNDVSVHSKHFPKSTMPKSSAPKNPLSTSSNPFYTIMTSINTEISLHGFPTSRSSKRRTFHSTALGVGGGKRRRGRGDLHISPEVACGPDIETQPKTTFTQFPSVSVTLYDDR